MKYLLILLAFVSVSAYGQSIGYWRYDTVKLQKIGGNSELVILNGSRSLIGAGMYNMGNGRTAFVNQAGDSPVLPPEFVKSGFLWYDSTGADSGLYVYHMPYWVKVGQIYTAGKAMTLTGSAFDWGGRSSSAIVVSMANNSLKFDSLGPGTRLVSYPQALTTKGVRISSTNGTDSATLSIEGSTTTATRTALMNVNSTSTGNNAYIRLRTAASLTDINLNVSGARQHESVIAMDSNTVQVYRRNSSVIPFALPSAMSFYDDSIVTYSDGRNIIRAGTYIDQYAVDSLIWRMDNRSADFFLSPGFARMYADDSLVAESESGYYRFTDLLSTADSSLYKPAVFDINGKLRRGNSWGNFAGGGTTPGLQSVITADPNLIGDNTITSSSGTFLILKSQTPGGGLDVWSGTTSVFRQNDQDLFMPILPSVNYDTTTYSGIVANKTTGRLFKTSAFAGSSVVWSSITNPTGTQTLSFDDAELNDWTNGSNTETFHTYTSNSQTTGTTLKLQSSSTTTGKMVDITMTGTAADNGQVGLNVNLSGANASASKATYAGRFTNAHTGTTPLNWNVYTDAGVAGFGTPSAVDANAAVIIRQPNDGAASRGLRILSNNELAGAYYGYGKIIYSGQYQIEGDGGLQLMGNASAVYYNMTSTGLTNIGSSATATSTLNVAGSLGTAYRAITALRTLDATDNVIEVTANTFTVTLPTAVGITGRIYTITNSGSGVVTLATTSSQTFVNVTATPTTLTLNQFNTVSVISNGANWLRTTNL